VTAHDSSGAADGEGHRPAGSHLVTVIDPIELPPMCETCDGCGGWTETLEGTNGHDVDVDFICKSCEGSGHL
jgi:DnaJ-class molecular chaperone